MQTNQNVEENDVKLLMNGLINDLKVKAPAHPKWVTWMDKGIEVGEWR